MIQIRNFFGLVGLIGISFGNYLAFFEQGTWYPLVYCFGSIVVLSIYGVTMDHLKPGIFDKEYVRLEKYCVLYCAGSITIVTIYYLSITILPLLLEVLIKFLGSIVELLNSIRNFLT